MHLIADGLPIDGSSYTSAPYNGSSSKTCKTDQREKPKGFHREDLTLLAIITVETSTVYEGLHHGIFKVLLNMPELGANKQAGLFSSYNQNLL